MRSQFCTGMMFCVFVGFLSSAGARADHARRDPTMEKIFVRLDYQGKDRWSAWVVGRVTQAHSLKEFAAAMASEADVLKQAGRDPKQVEVSIGDTEHEVPQALTDALRKAAIDAGFGEASTLTLEKPAGPPPDLDMRIVVVCDGSKAAEPSMAEMRGEVRKFVDTLKPIQSFMVIYYRDGDCEKIPQRLQLAMPAEKRDAVVFLDRVEPKGSGDPTAGLRAAFAVQPNTIHFVSTGDWGKCDVPALVKELNANGKVKVNVISLAGENEKVNQVLKRVVDENGGSLKVFKPEK